jgi:hypothetical protein
MRNVSDKSCRENQNTHFIFSNSFTKIVPFVDNVETYDRPGEATDGNILRRMRIACWIPKATHTHTHTYYILYLLLFHGNSGFVNALNIT